MRSLNECDACDWEAFLDGGLDSAGSDRCELHLESCEVCQRRVEQSAAEASVWRETRDLLRDETAGLFACTPTEVVETPTQVVRSLLSPSDDPTKLGRIGTLEVSGVIGYGGMGVVLKAWDPALNRYVAVKALLPHLAGSPAARRRFVREAQTAAAVIHDNVIAIHSVEYQGPTPFLVMPYVKGESLQRRLDRNGGLTLLEVLRIGMQVARGLAAAHEQGLIHRDIKPANILLPMGVERVLITDFGLARTVDDATLTQSGVIAGTPQYMSPEQAKGEMLTPASDLFSLGSVMYAMAVGRPPFRAESAYATMRRIIDEPARPLRSVDASLPYWFEKLVSRLQAKSLSDRFGSAAEVAEILEGCIAYLQGGRPELPDMLLKDVKGIGPTRRKTIVPLAAVSLVAAVASYWAGRPLDDIQPSAQKDNLQSHSTVEFPNVDHWGTNELMREVETEIEGLMQESETAR